MDSLDAIAKVAAISADFLPIPIPDTDTANTTDTPDTDTDSIGTALIGTALIEIKKKRLQPTRTVS
jgi:acyl carrier protein